MYIIKYVIGENPSINRSSNVSFPTSQWIVLVIPVVYIAYFGDFCPTDIKSTVF
jgi:hypothetical protein